MNLLPEGSRSAGDATAWLSDAGVADATAFVARTRRKGRSSARVPYESTSQHAGRIVQVGHYFDTWYIRRID